MFSQDAVEAYILNSGLQHPSEMVFSSPKHSTPKCTFSQDHADIEQSGTMLIGNVNSFQNLAWVTRNTYTTSTAVPSKQSAFRKACINVEN